MKLAAVIVTYHPNIQEVEKNIATFADDVDLLILRDNSELPSDLGHFKQLYPNIVLLQDGHNIGLSTAYNQAIQRAQYHDCTHLMTMDQDSTFENFKEYRNQLEIFNDSAVGIFTCPINHDISQSGYRDTTVCQSGSVYTLNMLQKIGGFREDLFIGMVDAEMSLRAIERGYKIYQMTGCNLIQHIGANRIVKFLGKKIETSDYSPLRHYYDSRNRILLWYEFPYDITFKHKALHLWSRLKLIAKIAFFENKKIAKTKAILRGTWYGLRNQTKPFSRDI
ncbi:MAG: glycosyltransferase [Bacteroidales bacterium]|nr:glycosyltransferase [Bacteroidales bacterium]